MQTSKTSLFEPIDSLKNKAQSKKLQHQLDSLKKITSFDDVRINKKIDTHKSTDSIKIVRVAADKTHYIQNVSDSVQIKISDKRVTLKKNIHKRTSFTDSLSMSVKNPVTNKAFEANAGVKQGFAPPLSSPNRIDMPRKDASGISTTTGGLNIPNIEKPNELKNSNSEVAKIEQLPASKINELTATTGLGQVKGEMQKVSSATDKIEAYNTDLKNISSGNTDKVETITKDAENAAMNQGQLKDLSNEVKTAEGAKNVLRQYQDAAAKMNEEGGKKAIKDIASKRLPDLFAGREEKLQAGVAQLEKLKRKYGSIPDSRYLPRHAPSDMKGKPFIERLVPGINFQFFQLSGLTITDFSPFMMYRFTSRWRAGAGGTYRLQFNKKIEPVHTHDSYGYRIMTDYKVISGFHAHVEVEWMNMTPYDPATNNLINDSEKKQWIPALYLGILKQYKAGKHVNGNFQVIYNFLYHRNGLYPNKFNIRFGFEFPLKRKSKG